LRFSTKAQPLFRVNIFSGLVSRFQATHPDHHAIASGMLWVALFALLGALARAAREMAIAYRYGVSAEVDAYLFVFNLVCWPIAVWFSVLAIVLVPLSARIRQHAPAELATFRSELLGLALLLGVVLACIAWAGLSVLLRSTWTGLPAATVTYALTTVPVLSLLAPLGVLIALFSAWMLTAGRHANTLLEGVPALVLLVALIAVAGGGLAPLVWGTLIGFALHMAILGFYLARHGELEPPRFSLQSAQWSPFWQGFGIMLAGQALMSLVGIVDQFFVARLGTGAIATLSYANRILQLMLGLGAMAVSRATLPVFSRAQAQGQVLRHVYRMAMLWARLLFALGVATMVVLWWLAPWAVGLLFERGAFTAQDTQVVSGVLRYGLAQLPFCFAGMVLVSLLASQRKYRLIAIGAGANLCIKLAANFLLVPAIGINGVMAATAIMYGGSFAMLSWFVAVSMRQQETLAA
jgi:putative peptidoglycan lipid II flippase